MARIMISAAAALAAAACAALPPTPPAEAPSAGAQCATARPAAAGLSHRQIESDGSMREYSLYVPRSYDGRTATPVVFDFQASGVTPALEVAITGMDSAAEERGFILVAPAAVTAFARGGHTWNVPRDPAGVDDVAFVADVLEDVRATLCVDAARVYAAGFSGGARLASELACAMPGRFAAISAVAGLRHPPACAPGAPPTSVLAFHSVDDPLNHYEHQPDRSPPWWTYGVDQALARWSSTLGCSAEPEAAPLAPGVERLDYSGCGGGARLAFYRLSGAGHTWPGSAFAFPAELGPVERQIDATVLTVEFFLGPQTQRN
jgi:polyhydroxybutyrate depolymerase